MTHVQQLFAADEAATLAIGAALAGALEAGTVIHLQGDLGAGKTTLARGIVQALAPGQRVKSPTYTLVEHYALPRFALLHLDLYRLADPSELEFLGVREHAGDAVLLVEWPQRAVGAIPPADLLIELAVDGAGRSLQLLPNSSKGAGLVSAVSKPTS